MTYLTFEWNGDKYHWDLHKAGKCTVGYVLIFVTAYHVLHLLSALVRDMSGNGGGEEKNEKKSTKNIQQSSGNDGIKERNIQTEKSTDPNDEMVAKAIDNSKEATDHEDGRNEGENLRRRKTKQK